MDPFLQVLVPSVFEPMWTLSLDKNSYRPMLHEEPSPFVCSKPGSDYLCVMVPGSYIGRDRKKLIPQHLLQATPDFVDIYHVSLKLSLFQPEDSYYYLVVPHVDFSCLSHLYCSYPVFIYPFQKKGTSASHSDMAFYLSEWSSLRLLDSLEGILLLPEVLEEFSPGFDSFGICFLLSFGLLMFLYLIC